MKKMNGSNKEAPVMPPKGGKRPPLRVDVLKRLLSLLFEDYKPQLIAVAVCVVMVSVASTVAGLFMTRFISYVQEALAGGGWESIRVRVWKSIAVMLVIYVLGWIAAFQQARIMAVVTQDFLHRTRKRVFSKMETLPLRYFDTHPHGDIMSHYTNDIDTLRELVSRTLPQILSSGLIVALLIFNMLYLSVWMALLVGLGMVAMIFVTKLIGGNSARYFIRMQKSIAKTEGFVEEMMHGQKVVKAFCH
jgi:ATP-binding cassette subfamily B protein